MRRAPLPTLPTLALLLGVFACGSARAQRGVATETFRPAVDGYGIFTVERAEVGKQWDFGFRLLVDYAHQPLRLNMKDGTGTPFRYAVMTYQLTAHLGLHMSLADWLELAIVAPVSAQGYGQVYGSIDDPLHPTGFYAGASPTNVGAPNAAPQDTRVALKLAIPRLGPVGIAVIAEATLPFGDESAFLGDRGFTFRPTAVIDLTLGKFTAALNAGYVLRQQTFVLEPQDTSAKRRPAATLIEVDDELAFSVGAAYRIIPLLGIGAEVYGLFPLATAAASPERTAAAPDRVLDALAGLHLFPGRDLTIAVGGGAGLLPLSSRHDTFRVFVGLSWAPVEGARAASFGAGAADSDGDGIPDVVDTCPKEAEDKDGFDDEDGCPEPDNDQDGVADGQDKCPNAPEDKDGFQDDDGCPELDNDGDGIPDSADTCPGEPEDKDGFQDEDGCPDLDNDGDGIGDDKDRCPNEPETRNGVDDEDGCPDTGGQVAIGQGKVEIPEQVQFETGRATILARSFSLLERIAEKLRTADVKKVRIEGHTDDSGGVKKNQDLSQARADSVLEFLVKKGVEATRLQAAGYGSSRPIASNKSADGRAKNRRVEFIIVEQ
ncbi:MAG: hypothetical protein EXR72_12695 [Myxococcales bacterium]|nr:hypothetical protein [Myxococcales bacterium]